jgi:hypothetical protein
MQRREFITGLGNAAASPMVAREHQRSTPVVGFVAARSGRSGLTEPATSSAVMR